MNAVNDAVNSCHAAAMNEGAGRSDPAPALALTPVRAGSSVG